MRSGGGVRGRWVRRKEWGWGEGEEVGRGKQWGGVNVRKWVRSEEWGWGEREMGEGRGVGVG